MRKEQKTWGLRLLLLCLLIGCVCFIFANSLQGETDSDERSGSVTEWINAYSLFGWTVPEELIRKMAHFAEFALLGFLALLNLRQITPRLIENVSWPLLLGTGVALADETIQLHVPGRSGALGDVWLDCSGVLTGVLLGLLLLRILRAARQRRRTAPPPAS